MTTIAIFCDGEGCNAVLRPFDTRPDARHAAVTSGWATHSRDLCPECKRTAPDRGPTRARARHLKGHKTPPPDAE